MARRKAPLQAQDRHPNLSHDASTGTKLSAREYYNHRYKKVDKKHRSACLYADVTNLHIDRIEGLWREYCKIVEIDPYYTLKRSKEGRIKNFFHWLCNNYSVQKVSSIETYSHQLSQLYIKWKGRRMNPLTLKQIYDFIHGPLADEHELDESETDKPLLDVVDFVEVLRCHWVMDTNTFPHERQRVQLATILLLAALTGSRPGALLGITYRDLDLFVQRDQRTGEMALTLQLQLKRTKSRQKRKRPKTYTFFIDTNPLFCIISHIVSLACDDDAYVAPDITPGKVLRLGVREGLNCQPIPWKPNTMDTPVFRTPVQTAKGTQTSPEEALTYSKYHEWVKRLGEETGFVQVLTTYCLRRATGNAINDDPDSNDAVRNLVMDHTNSAIFQKNYLSRMIRYDTQAAYRGTAPRTELIRAANRMSRLIDPRRPKGLTDEQRDNLRQEAEIKELCYRRDQLYSSIRSEFTFLYLAEGAPIHDEYQQAKREVERAIKARERALKKLIQAQYDAMAPVNDIRAQLEGNMEPVDRISPSSGPIEYAFVERSRIANAFFDPPSALRANGHGDVDWRVSIVEDLVSLCTLQEGRFRKARRKQRTQAIKGHPDDLDSDCTSNPVKSESESQVHHSFPLKCKPYQCLVCLGNHTLPLDERRHNLGSKFSLQRHFDRSHTFRPGESCPFPHLECAATTLDSLMQFKNHAAKVHGIYMSEKA
ncbi:hypothetical protein MMC30_007326 [Trapelia coarctata]|nr:hypothetical protein [Trapelia coarctata]